jgi:hypothetical protein
MLAEELLCRQCHLVALLHGNVAATLISNGRGLVFLSSEKNRNKKAF